MKLEVVKLEVVKLEVTKKVGKKVDSSGPDSNNPRLSWAVRGRKSPFYTCFRGSNHLR